ncbi:hypothetical protein [Vibrio alginolyticus]|uniref:hypothetical protein n=1 Tax=Vibrio alginolyticus TaxID=663 RepID=UPI0006CA85E6|nr:hypothetical protein [Vibrio alginolyticus]KPM98340.1 hypothetical protein AOG25_07795 [Vibrio alginolyticus]
MLVKNLIPVGRIDAVLFQKSGADVHLSFSAKLNRDFVQSIVEKELSEYSVEFFAHHLEETFLRCQKLSDHLNHFAGYCNSAEQEGEISVSDYQYALNYRFVGYTYRRALFEAMQNPELIIEGMDLFLIEVANIIANQNKIEDFTPEEVAPFSAGNNPVQVISDWAQSRDLTFEVNTLLDY